MLRRLPHGTTTAKATQFTFCVALRCLYRGPDFTHESGVAYRNVASYLKSL